MSVASSKRADVWLEVEADLACDQNLAREPGPKLACRHTVWCKASPAPPTWHFSAWLELTASEGEQATTEYLQAPESNLSAHALLDR